MLPLVVPSALDYLTKKFLYFLFACFCTSGFYQAQNQTNKWHFGINAGLDFMTNPPTVISTSSINTSEGCSSISDAAGNLLFYTDGVTVYNSTNQVMSNGTALFGFSSSSQSAIIVKQPGNSNIYYVFTQGALFNGTRYSIVDMSLSAGQGSVTAKNVLIQSPSSEKLTAVRHCNGIDYWIVTHDNSMNIFYTYSLTAAGVNTVGVSSTIGSFYSGIDYIGILKFSPNGKKLASSLYGNSDAFELYDFDAATGVVSNSLSLGNSFTNAYGCEFSQDGTKFYGSGGNGYIYQWDLCAGSNTAIVASQYTVTSSQVNIGCLQLASNGKIYCPTWFTSSLSVINNPNALGASCNFTANSLSVLPGACRLGLPGFVASSFITPTPLFTYTVSNTLFGCYTTSFTALVNAGSFVNLNCASSGYSLNSLSWNFGDPLSGSSNTSNIGGPGHTYPGLGSYTVQLIVNYSCGGGIDTLTQVVNITQPCLTINSASITCASLGSATVTMLIGTGPFTYTWVPGGQTTQVATGLNPGTYTVWVTDVGTNTTFSAVTVFTSLVPFVGLLDNSNSVPCPGAATGTAAIALYGGSGNQSYLWSNGVVTQTTPTASNLAAGVHSLLVLDALTSCSVTQSFFISQPPAFNLLISASSTSACSGTSISFTASNSGGNFSPAYTYTWSGGPQTDTYAVSQPLAGNYIYTVSSKDVSNCAVSNTIAVDFVDNPILSVTSTSICPFETGILNAFGASTYIWNNVSIGTNFSDAPLVTTQYSVVGSALGCTTAATGTIALKPVPVLTVTPNTTICEAGSYTFSASGGTAYVWAGPQSFSSLNQLNTLNALQLNQAGLYQVTVTALNSCTASISTSLTVNPLPVVSILLTATTICVGSGAANLAAGGNATSFSWLPVAGLSSSNTQITSASPNATTVYTVTGSLNSCTSQATATVNVIQPPNLTLSLNSNSVCAQPLNGSQTSIWLTGSGATAYTINVPGFLFNSNPSGPASQLTVLPPYLITGAVTTTLYGSNGVCTSSITESFSIVPNPSINLLNPNGVICPGDNYTFSASGASAYNWSAVNPANVIIPNGNQALVSPTLTANYVVYGSSLGCASASQFGTVTVNPFPTILISPVATICIGNVVDLVAGGTGTSFTWSPTLWLSGSNSRTVTANPPTLQTYSVVASLNSCTRSAVVTVSVLPLPIALITVTKSVLCANETIALNGSGGSAYQWNGPSGYASTLQGVLIPASLPGISGVFTLTVKNGNLCQSSTTQKVTVNDLPKGFLTANKMFGCAPFCSDFKFKPSSGTSDISELNWSFSGSVITGTAFSHCFEKPGEYHIVGVIKDVNDCMNTTNAVVNVYPLPRADFSFLPEQPYELMDEVVFTTTSLGEKLVEWNWFFVANNGYRSSGQQATYRFESQGTYPVAMVVKNTWGCIDTVVKTISVLEDYEVFMPNAFTPNNDGLNDVFIPTGRGIRNYSLLIFDRWGEFIFKSGEQFPGWNGTWQGKIVKEDVYTWQMSVTNIKGETRVLYGYVTVQK